MKIIKINAMWCPACIVMHKVWDKINTKYPDLDIISYDYDMDEEIIKEYNPGELLPVIIFLVDDKEVERLRGEKTEEEISKVIEKYK